MLIDQIRQVRSFNRTVTQRVGALGASFLDRGRPLGEARLIYEIGAGGADVKGLRERLALDSGYLSRLLRSLERQGLVRLRSGSEDARVRHVVLTPEGRNELSEYDRRSDAFAQSVLASLSNTQRDRLVTAMAVVERLMRAAAVEIGMEKPDSADAAWCLEQYSRELAQRFEGGYDPNKTRTASPAELTPPAGCFVVAYLDGQPIGCGALKVGPDEIGEIKRLWVDSGVRGLGVGRRILQTLEENARLYGAALLRLDTNRALTEAQALYRASGYREAAPFNDETYAHHWFEKTLPVSAPPAPKRVEGKPERRPPN
jgi:DNA-binding MarR family transcriptional regulator/N-acetylglutamate synthase-like GNAT family acetyltransferase